MISAIFIKSYKIYINIKFIPLAGENYFSAIIGQNGTGKSSVLEALDTYFNNRDWNINTTSKRSSNYINTPYIAPVFLFKKENIRQSDSFYKLIELVSDYLWSVERKQVNSPTSETSEFFKYRDELKNSIDFNNYFLLIAGKRFEKQNDIYFGPFHHQDSFLTHIGYETSVTIQKKEKSNEEKQTEYAKENKYIQDKFSGIVEYVQKKYSYIYIPSDIDATNYTKLETDNIQKLMGKNIKDVIQNIIKQKTLNEINKSLNNFITEISLELQTYTYKKPKGGKSNLTMPDLVSTIIKEFFSIRYLAKNLSGNFIPIQDLSSGEKRKSLIDLACAFLSQDEREKKIILAIDEPEMSMHISLCFNQFEKLLKLSKSKHQVILTTHWYGFLPVMQSGTAIFLNLDKDKVIAEKFNLENYRESIVQTKRKEKGKMPYDISLKGNYDLLQSIILSIMTPNAYKWILCEGSSEQIYFSKFFEKEIENRHLRILPLGGCGEIVKLYKHLEASIDSDTNMNGKVLALIDSDELKNPFIHSKRLKCLEFKRLYFQKNKKLLIDICASESSHVTEIEDSLEPALYCETLSKLGNLEVRKIITENPIQKGSFCSYDAMDLKPSQNEKIKNYFNSCDGSVGNKKKFAEAYVSSSDFDANKEPLYKEIMSILDK